MRRLVLVGLVSAMLAACGGKEEQPAPPPPEVGVLTAQPTQVALRKDLVGRLSPIRSADVRARVPGVLQQRVYQEGSDVSEGQVLFRIDPAPLQAELGNARGALAQAQANAANAKAAATRARGLAPQRYISQSDLDDALAQERSAAAALESAKAAVQSAEINLGYATVRAPIAGRAGKQQVTEGALVGSGATTLLTTVDQVDTLYVNFSLSVDELNAIRGLQLDRSQGAGEVEIVLPNGATYGEKGVLDFSGDIVDPTTGSVSLRATLPNPERTLLPGTYVTLRANMGQQSNVFLVPQAAVQRDANSAYVMVVGEGDKVARKNIVTDRAQDAQWVVTGGIAAGDRIVVSGVPKAKPDAVVKPTPWQPGQPAANGAPAAAGAAPQGAAAPAAAQPAEAGEASADAPAQEAAPAASED